MILDHASRIKSRGESREIIARFVLDIGGEGGTPQAWNLNPSPTKTCGPERGRPIPNLIVGRSTSLPFANGSIPCIVLESTPLVRGALQEIARVIAPGGTIIVRHVPLANRDRHALAKQILPGCHRSRIMQRGARQLLETVFEVAG